MASAWPAPWRSGRTRAGTRRASVLGWPHRSGGPGRGGSSAAPADGTAKQPCRHPDRQMPQGVHSSMTRPFGPVAVTARLPGTGPRRREPQRPMAPVRLAGAVRPLAEHREERSGRQRSASPPHVGRRGGRPHCRRGVRPGAQLFEQGGNRWQPERVGAHRQAGAEHRGGGGQQRHRQGSATLRRQPHHRVPSPTASSTA